MKKCLFFSIPMLLLFSTTGIAQAPPIPPRCTTPEIVETADSYISSVRLGSIYNNSTRSAGGYGHYTNLSTNVTIGSSYTITVKSSGTASSDAFWSVYIDYNKNGVLGDAGELIGSSGRVAAGSSVSFTFTPPATSFNGPAVLQVRMTQSSSAPCVIYQDDGEKEDYTVNISGGFCSSRGTVSASDYISNVTVGGISKTSGNDGGYANYTSSIANFTSTYTYPISLSRLPSSSSRYEYWTVFIDYNNNKSFADAGDLVALASGTNVSVASIKIPFLMAKETGTVRMRIIMSHDGYKTDPCATITNGEVEDYSAKLLMPVLSNAKTTQTISSLRNDEASVSVQPNPATSSNAVVRYTVAATGNVNICITDLGARSVFVYHAGNKMAGTYTYALSSSHNLIAGVYLLTIEQNGQEIAHTKLIMTP